MKIFKQALVTTALVGSLATPTIAAECTFSGAYLGVQGGLATAKTNFKYSETAPDQDKESKDLGALGFGGGLHVGYGKQFVNNFYLGFEVDGNLYSSEAKETTNRTNPVTSSTIKAQRTNSFGAAIKPGFVVGNALLYAKLGVESANFKYSMDAEGNGQKLSKAAKGRRLGFVPGLGIAYNVTSHVMLGLEATYGMYKKANIENFGDAAARNKSEFSSKTADVFARISYKW
jgi:outer membrane immunogenic protein